MANPFTQPYRENGTRKGKVFSIIAFGLFIFLFLFIFRPFGLYQVETLKTLFVTLGFGAITSFMLIIFKFVIEPLLANMRWTLGKHILWDMAIASGIGIANYIYISIIFHVPLTVKYMLYSVWTAWLVGFIPVTISYMIYNNRQYRNALKEAAIPEEKIFWDDEVLLTAGNEKNEMRVNPREILYICSNDNYVTVVNVREGIISKITIRGTLKSVEEELRRNTRFIRCHKCYIINLDYIERISGHSQNMKVKLLHCDDIIPVSRAKAGLLACR
jgi:hypothetical protein